MMLNGTYNLNEHHNYSKLVTDYYLAVLRISALDDNCDQLADQLADLLFMLITVCLYI